MLQSGRAAFGLALTAFLLQLVAVGCAVAASQSTHANTSPQKSRVFWLAMVASFLSAYELRC